MSREEVLSLIRQKEELERKIDSIRAELSRHGVSEFDTLLTFDGFPRADLDIPTIRALRVQLIHQENDLKAILEEISHKLPSAFPTKDRTTQKQPSAAPKPLGRIRAVLSGSPGDVAGLQADDLIMKLGKANKLEDLSNELSRAAAHHEPLRVVVQRFPDWQSMQIDVPIPPGRSLGCHIVSI